VSSAGETFLRAARPSLGVVSAGRGNRFGHPHPLVLRRFRALGAPVVRTDVDGAITVTTDGHVAHVVTFTGRTIMLPGVRRRAVH
jgi:competence protein ComEC